MHDTLSGRAEELGRLTDLIRTSLSLADSSIPGINEQLDELAAMGLDNLELEGPLVYSRAAGCSPNFDDARVIFAATLVMPGGLGCTIWSAEEYAERYGESGHEPPDLRERFASYDRLPAIVRATLKDRTVNGTFANVRTAMTDGSVRGWRHVPGARALQSPATASECPRSGLFSPSAQPGSGSGLAAVEARRFAAAVRARGCRSRGTRLAWFGRHLDRHAPGRDRATAWAARGRVRAGAVRVARRSPRESS